MAHEDFRLIRDETVGIFVTFADRSIQEFVGALYFIVMFSKGMSLEDLLEGHMSRPLFMTEPLFLHFCLWFLHENQSYIPIHGKKDILRMLVQFCAKRIHSGCLHIPNIAKCYPALDFVSDEKNNDKIMSEFYSEMFKLLKSSKTIVAHSVDPFVWMMKKMPNITHISVGTGLKYFIFPESRTIKLYTKEEKNLSNMLVPSILERCKDFGRSARLQVFLQGVKGCGPSTEAILPFGKSLTHLYVLDYYLGKNEIKVLSDAVGREVLFNLRHLCFKSCHIREFPLLFKNSWPSLCHLQFYRCFLSEHKCSIVAKVVCQPNRLPRLKSLAIAGKNTTHDPVGISSLFKKPLKSISHLSIDLENWRYLELEQFTNADPGLGQGGGKNFRGRNLSQLSVFRRCAIKARYLRQGSRAR